MTIKILYIFYWDAFKLSSSNLYRILDKEKYSFDNIKNLSLITDRLLASYNIICCGSFMPPQFSLLIQKYAHKTIVDITEPIQFINQPLYRLVVKNIFRGYGCCVSDIAKSAKYPLYMNCLNKNKNNLIEITNKLKNTTIDELNTKKFCCLINRHDNGRTRGVIYNKLKTIDKIVCPSNLFNNFPNAKFEKIGRETFQSDFIFNICCENYVTGLAGYVTEKLAYACVSRNIPIYYGKLDDIDKSIFNINRILYFNPTDQSSINNLVNKVKELMGDKNKLLEFYSQSPFTENAISQLDLLSNKYATKIKSLL
jgi:hypothetical protein